MAVAETFLCVALVWLVLQRLMELAISRGHEARLRGRGARESGRGHFPFLLALHVAYPVAVWVEVTTAHTTPPTAWPLWLALTLAAQGLRVWSMHALGEHWTARVLVLPGEYVPRRGPYRFLAEPSYTAVTIELAAFALTFGAWRTALVASILNAIALSIRIPVERRALREVALAASRGAE